MTTSALTPTEQFFYDHAGSSYGPDESPDAGRTRGARELASAEAKLNDSPDYRVRWEPEPYWTPGDLGDLGDEIAADIEAGKYTVPMSCLLERWNPEVDGGWTVEASLGMIVMESMDDPYRRVVEAELADEAFAS